MIVGGVWLYNSIDGGTTFTQKFGAVHADMHRIVHHPGFDGISNKTVFFATDGGIFKTTDVYASSAFDLNNNLGVTQFYGGGINPDTGHIIGGTQDNGTLFYSGDPQDWIIFLAVTAGMAPRIRWIPTIFTGKFNEPEFTDRPQVAPEATAISTTAPIRFRMQVPAVPVTSFLFCVGRQQPQPNAGLLRKTLAQ